MISTPFKRKRRSDGKLQTSRTYYAKIRLSGESRISVISLGVTDKQVAQEKLSQIIRDNEKESVGLLPSKLVREASQQRLTEHLKDYLLNLQTMGRDTKYIHGVRKQLEVLMAKCGWEFYKDITARSFETWRADQKKAAKTLNEYLIAANAFLNWLKRRSKGMMQNPLEYVQKAQGNGEATFRRRAFTQSQMQDLLAVAGERKAVYLTAVFTGLRRGELESLEWRDVHLDVERPFLAVRASTTKNHKSALIPLHGDVVQALRELRGESVVPVDRVFEGLIPTMSTFRKDLEAAGILYVNTDGERGDFHSLRKTFQMLLTLNGALPRVAMELMRHSDMKLTTKTYTDAGMLPTGETVRNLPCLDLTDKNQIEKGTLKGTQNLVPAGLVLSHSGTHKKYIKSSGRSLDAGFRPDESRDVTVSHDLEKWCAMQGSNRLGSVDCQLLANTGTQKGTPNCILPPDLGEILNAWPRLPRGLQAGVLAIVRSFQDGTPLPTEACTNPQPGSL